MMEVSIKELIESILLKKIDDKNDIEFELFSKYLDICAYENDLVNRNVNFICGVDEVGRGPIAGPVVSCAIILPIGYYLPGLNDSKKLTEKKRHYYYDLLIKDAISYGIGVVDVNEIDKYNIYTSTKMAMIKAINNLSIKPQHLLVDAMTLNIDIPQTSIIKGDEKSVSIAAASIIAKVYRDRYMDEISKEYPEYHFEKNKGYGTKEHFLALEKYGPTIYHRKSFNPVREMLERKYNLFNLD